MTSLSIQSAFDKTKLLRLADVFAVATAASLPWSTSVTGILTVLWLVALIPALTWAEMRRELMSPAGGLPVALVLLGLAGMLWADVSLLERWKGVESFFKLLPIPLFLAHFRKSERAEWVFGGYALACVVLLAVSYILAIWPQDALPTAREYGVPVRNAASQSGEFVTCIFGLTYVAYEAVVNRRWLWGAGLIAVCLAMLGNIFFVATGRTALVLIFVLTALFALRKLSGRGLLIFVAAAVAVGAVAWFASPYLRDRTSQIWDDYKAYAVSDARNSSGERIEFAKKSIEFIREAPIIGHGTGTITTLFVRSTAGLSGAEGSATTNPHNQTFAVAIQLGLVGAIVLWAMWLAHLLLFRGSGLIAWIGLVLVVQNVIGSAFNSHLFDFLQGWIYVIGVGVAGGAALKRHTAAKQP